MHWTAMEGEMGKWRGAPVFSSKGRGSEGVNQGVVTIDDDSDDKNEDEVIETEDVHVKKKTLCGKVANMNLKSWFILWKSFL